MEDNRELVEETEKTELTAEEIEDVESDDTEVIDTEETKEETAPVEETFTKEQVNAMVEKRLRRQENKLRREYANKYGKLETVVKAGLGTDTTEEAVEKLTEFYSQKGINIPEEPTYTSRDLEVLANAEANEIISEGYEDIVEETERLANIGTKNMTEREKLVFKKLAEERQRIEEIKELNSIGIKMEDLDNEEFKEFANKLNPELSLKEKYDMYQKIKPKKEVKTIGSMKGVPESRYKDYYTPEEIARLTEEDLDDPRVWDAVRKSMTGRN